MESVSVIKVGGKIAEDVAVLNAFLHALSAAELWSRALAYFEEMRSWQPNTITYNFLIKVCGKSQQPDAAFALLRSKQEEVRQADCATCSSFHFCKYLPIGFLEEKNTTFCGYET